MDALDLYDDLDEFQEKQEKDSKELQELENKYQQSLKTIEDLQAENKTLKKTIKTIKLNFQSLLDTARAEIKRKNKEIDQLRKEKDDICFRRKLPHKVESQKQPENLTQTFKRQEIKNSESQETFTPQPKQTHEDKAENKSNPGRDESLKRNRSREPDHINDSKRLKNIRDDREQHKDRCETAYKSSRQNDEKPLSHDHRKYDGHERNRKTESPERYGRSLHRSQSHKREDNHERDKKNEQCESPEKWKSHRRPFNRSRSRESYRKHDKPHHSNSLESSNSHRKKRSRIHKHENKYLKSTSRRLIHKSAHNDQLDHKESFNNLCPEDLNSPNEKVKQENKSVDKVNISVSAQHVSNKTETNEIIDEVTVKKLCKDMTVDPIKSSTKFDLINREEKYEHQPKENDSDLKKSPKSINSCVKANRNDHNANTRQIKHSSEEHNTITLQTSSVTQSSVENQFDKTSESHKQQSSLKIEASKLSTPCKVALYNEIFGQSPSTTTSSTKSLFNNIKGLLANFAPNEDNAIAAISSVDCTEASGCKETIETNYCNLNSESTENIARNEMDKTVTRKENKSSETAVIDLTKVINDNEDDEIQYIQIPGLDLCGGNIIENRRTGLFTKQQLVDDEIHSIIKQSNKQENNIQNVMVNSCITTEMSDKLHRKDAEKQKDASESIQIQSNAHARIDNAIELEDVNRNVKQKSSFEMSSKQILKDNIEPNKEIKDIHIKLNFHLVPDENIKDKNLSTESHKTMKDKKSLEDINKNVKQKTNREMSSNQNFKDKEKLKEKGEIIQFDSKYHLVPDCVTQDKSQSVKSSCLDEDKTLEQIQSRKSPELNKSKTYFEDVNQNIKKNKTLEEPAEKKLKDNKKPKKESENIQIGLQSYLKPDTITQEQNQFTKGPEGERETVTQQDQEIEKTEKTVIENIKCKEDFAYKILNAKTTPELNKNQAEIANNRNVNLNATNEENTLYDTLVSSIESSKITTIQESEEANVICHVAHVNVNNTEIKNSDSKSNNENLNMDCQLEEDSNEKMNEKIQNSEKFSGINNDMESIEVHETYTSENISNGVLNNKSSKEFHIVEATKTIDEQYPLENQISRNEIIENAICSDKLFNTSNDLFETQDAHISENIQSDIKNNEIIEILNRDEMTNSSDEQHPLEHQDCAEEIIKSGSVTDKPNDNDNDSNKTKTQDACISGKSSPNVKINENIETSNTAEGTNTTDEQYLLDNQDFSIELTRIASGNDKLNDYDDDSSKTRIRAGLIAGKSSQNVKLNESIDILNTVEDTKPSDKQYSCESKVSSEEITNSAHDSDKPNNAENISDQTQVKETYISGNFRQDVKNNENLETLNRLEVPKETDDRDSFENQGCTEEITENANDNDKPNDNDNNLDKIQAQESHISGNASQNLKTNESLESHSVDVPEAANEHDSFENQDCTVEITENVNTKDKINDNDNDLDKIQAQELLVHISENTSQDLKTNESIELPKATEEQDSFENKDCTVEITENVNTKDKINDNDNGSDKIQAQELLVHISGNASQDLKTNESIESQSVELPKATEEQDSFENQDCTEEITENVNIKDKMNDNDDSDKIQAQEILVHISENTSQDLKSNENTETNREEVTEETVLKDDGDRITVNEKQTNQTPIMFTFSADYAKENDGLQKDNKVKVIQRDSLTKSNANDLRSTIISGPHTRKSNMDDTMKQNSTITTNPVYQTIAGSKEENKDVSLDKQTKSAIKANALLNTLIEKAISTETLLIYTDLESSKRDPKLDLNVVPALSKCSKEKKEPNVTISSSRQSKPQFQPDSENMEKVMSSSTNTIEAETNLLKLDLKDSALPQSCTDKDDCYKTTACHTFNETCKTNSNSSGEDLRPLLSLLKPSMPITPKELQNKTENIGMVKQTEVVNKNISNPNNSSCLIADIKRNEDEKITKQTSAGIKSIPNSEVLKVKCNNTSIKYQHVDDFQKISPALPESFNTSPVLPSISTSSPTPSNFSGIFSKTSHLSTAEEDFHKLKKKSLHFNTRPREFIIPAASVLCNVNNLENATKVKKKLHWELLDSKNELTEIEDDTDIDSIDEEHQKLAGQIKQEQVTPQQSPKDVQDEQSNLLSKPDIVDENLQVNYKIQNMSSKVGTSKYCEQKLSKSSKSNLKNVNLNKRDSLTDSSIIDEKPFTIILPKRQRGRPRKLGNQLKATMKSKTGPRILKKRGRKPKKPIEFTESFHNNSDECAMPTTEVTPPKENTTNTQISESKCALNVQQNEELPLKTSVEISLNCDSTLLQEEQQYRQSSDEVNDKSNQQKFLESSRYTKNSEDFTRDQIISNESETKSVKAIINEDNNDAEESFQISAIDGPIRNSVDKKSNLENNKTVDKAVTFPLKNDNNCDDVSITSGDSENKLLIISDGGGPEETNEKQAQVPSEEAKSLEKPDKKDKKYISLEQIGIKVRPFKGHLSTLRIPKINKNDDQTNAWKLETYEEVDKKHGEDKVENNKLATVANKIESNTTGSAKIINATNKGFLSSYRIPKIKRETEHCKDNLEKLKVCDKTPKEETQEKINKLSNNNKVTEPKKTDKTTHSCRPDKAGFKETSEKSKMINKQQKTNECANSGSYIVKSNDRSKTGKRKLFGQEMYNNTDHEDKLENTTVNSQTDACTERKLDDSKVIEEESPCFIGKPIKQRRKSLNLPRKIVSTSSDEEEKDKYLENVDTKHGLERNALHTKQRPGSHRRILDSNCDEAETALDRKIKEKQINKTNKSLNQRRKSMFAESPADVHSSEENQRDKKLFSSHLLRSTCCNETFNSKNEFDKAIIDDQNIGLSSSRENIRLLKTPTESHETSEVLSKDDGKDTEKMKLLNKTSKPLKMRRKSLFIETSSSKTTNSDETKLPDILKDDTQSDLKSLNDSIKVQAIENTSDSIELKRTKLLKKQLKHIYAESDSANHVKDSFEDLKTPSTNEDSKEDISGVESFDAENDTEIKARSTKGDLKEEKNIFDAFTNNANEVVSTVNEELVVTKQFDKDSDSSLVLTQQDSPKPRRKSINHRRILDSSSDDNEPLMKKPLLVVNEIKAPVVATELKSKSRKRRVVRVLSTSRDVLNTSVNSSLQSDNSTQMHSNSPSPLLNHPIFNREVSTQSQEFVASMPVTPNQQDDKKFKEIDSKLHQIFQSPQYSTDYKTNHTTPTNLNNQEILSTSLSDIQGINLENDQSPVNKAINKIIQSPHTTMTESFSKFPDINITIEETQLEDVNQENDQGSANKTLLNDSNAILNNTNPTAHNYSEIKHLSLGSAEYRFEKVSDNVVNLFISRKRKRKQHN